jgi:hypothetical protein
VSRKQHQELTTAAFQIARAIVDAKLPHLREERLKKAEMLTAGLLADLVAIQQPEPQDDAA